MAGDEQTAREATDAPEPADLTDRFVQSDPAFIPELLSNADIDALFREAAKTAPAPEPTPPTSPSPLLSNEDISALLNDFLSSKSPEPVSEVPETEETSAIGEPAEPEPLDPVPQTPEPLNNEDLDALLNDFLSKEAATAAPEPATSSPAEESQPFQDGPGTPFSEPEVRDEGAPAPPEPEIDEVPVAEPLTQDMIEALFSGVEPEPSHQKPFVLPEPEADAAEVPASEPNLLRNEDLEVLLNDFLSKEQASEPPSTEPAMEELEPEVPPAQAAMEALMPEIDAMQPPSTGEDEPAAPSTPAGDDRSIQLLDNDDLDSLLNDFLAEEKAEAAPGKGSSSPPVKPVELEELTSETPDIDDDLGEPEPLSQDMIEALLRQAQDPEPVPAAPPVQAQTAGPADPPSEDAQPVEEDEEPQESTSAPRRRLRIRLPLRSILSTAVGVGVTLGTQMYVAQHPYREATPENIASLQDTGLETVLPVARDLLAQGNYGEALRRLERVVKRAPDGDLRAAGEFACLEAKYRLLSEEPKIEAINEITAEIDSLVSRYPGAPGEIDALRWKAELLQRSDYLQGAYDTYAILLRKHPDVPDRDKLLLEAARAAYEVGRAPEAVEVLRSVLDDYPSSKWVPQVKTLLAEALKMSGDPEAAREALLEAARANPDTPAGAEAAAQLGEMAFNQGRFDETIQLLEERLQTATRVQGNDRIYLLLARAHRAKGDFASAERILRELIDFFPESPYMPQAMVHLSRVLDEQGRRDEAQNLATQAAARFEHDPETLKTAGRLLAETGPPDEAARMFLAAADAGAMEPDVLLQAARQFRLAKQTTEAVDAYQRLLAEYPHAPESQDGSIELARVLYDQGRVREAIGRLESQAVTATGAVQRVRVLSTLASLYAELGMMPKAAELYREVAGLTSDSELLAQAASALFRAGSTEDGLALARRVDTDMVPRETLYDFQMEYGKALLRTDPARGAALMEQTYQQYPDRRRPGDDFEVLKAQLAADRTASARAMVMDIDAHVKQNPVDAPRLIKAATMWGDYLYQRGDARGAAEAYAVGAAAPEETPSPETLWCRFQEANARLALEEFERCLSLYGEVAASDSEWKDAARVKADYVKLEMRRRGIPPPEIPKPEPEEG